MILDYENVIREGITRSISCYAEANNKFMHDYRDFISFHILILTMNMDGLYHNHLLIVDLNMLKMFQCLRNSDYEYT